MDKGTIGSVIEYPALIAIYNILEKLDLRKQRKYFNIMHEFNAVIRKFDEICESNSDNISYCISRDSKLNRQFMYRLLRKYIFERIELHQFIKEEPALYTHTRNFITAKLRNFLNSTIRFPRRHKNSDNLWVNKKNGRMYEVIISDAKNACNNTEFNTRSMTVYKNVETQEVYTRLASEFYEKFEKA